MYSAISLLSSRTKVVGCPSVFNPYHLLKAELRKQEEYAYFHACVMSGM